MSTVAFFPWLAIREELRFEDFELQCYHRGVAPSGAGTQLQATLDSIMERFLERGGQPIERATLLKKRDRHITDEMSEDEVNETFVFAELLATAGLSGREYFGIGHSYCNRDAFRLVVQSFQEHNRGIVRRNRRRDGVSTAYVTPDAYSVYRPDYVESPRHIQVDEHLLNSLWRAKNHLDHRMWTDIYESIFNFNAANTDSWYIHLEAELVFICSAFERLYQLGSGKEEDLARRFEGSLQPEFDLHPRQCQRLSDVVDTNRFTRSRTIRDMWIRDLYKLRGQAAHGKVEARYPSVWNIRDHLLLGSFVFPLVLKRALESNDHYTMSYQDIMFIDLFERLACEEHCIEQQDGECPWNAIVAQAATRLFFGENPFECGTAD